MKFYKYQGTGNDFIMIDDRTLSFPTSQHYIANLCHRRFGIGADGLILLQNTKGYDFRMIYYNADGTEGSMCGNGGRCIVRFAADLGIIEENTKFLAVDGEHVATLCDDDIYLQMLDNVEVEQHDGYNFANTGSPHYVTFTDDVEGVDVVGLGSSIRYSPEWQVKGGTNVNFVQILNDQSIAVRTYERGVEDETYACGTGVTACALTLNALHKAQSPIDVAVIGGKLSVSFQENENGTYSNVYLIGPAVKVFEGELF
jgi:diaminopimelate epimerase